MGMMGIIKRKNAWETNLSILVFLGPAMALLLIFKIYPILLSVIGSLFTNSFISGKKIFVAFENYEYLFSDILFYQSLKATFIFVGITTPVQITLALALSLCVKKNTRVTGVYRTIFMIPIAIALAISCLIWNILFNPNQGIVNSILTVVGIPAQPFFTSKHQALFGIIIICLWKGVGYWMMFLLAGIQGIPEQLYESARLDGARPLRILWDITLPLLRRALTFVFVADTTSNFLLFAPIYMITLGGPEMSTNFLMFEAFKAGFIHTDIGRSYSIVTILICITFSIVILEMRLLRPKH
jgi:multiple sugar transport system permease protein